ncbi:MAG TPA: hypothetical protein VFY06_04005 [Verrucomicrobiae bacterium]|nr:hypothetical protein [Verrucomicrobiae bacterium]
MTADSKSSQLRQLVAGARSRLAELQVEFAREKSRVDATEAALFLALHELNLKRDRLRLAAHYRQKFLDSFARNNMAEAEQTENDLKQAKAQLDEDYEELVAAAEKKKPLTAEEETGLAGVWETLVKLIQPGRFDSEPANLEAFRKLMAGIERAKGDGDLKTMRDIAEDPQGFLLRQGCVSLDFTDPEDLPQMQQLHDALQKEIAAVAGSLEELRATSEYELCQSAGQKPGYLAELATERGKQIGVEIAELEAHAEKLAAQIQKLCGKDKFA